MYMYTHVYVIVEPGVLSIHTACMGSTNISSVTVHSLLLAIYTCTCTCTYYVGVGDGVASTSGNTHAVCAIHCILSAYNYRKIADKGDNPGKVPVAGLHRQHLYNHTSTLTTPCLFSLYTGAHSCFVFISFFNALVTVSSVVLWLIHANFSLENGEGNITYTFH